MDRNTMNSGVPQQGVAPQRATPMPGPYGPPGTQVPPGHASAYVIGGAGGMNPSTVGYGASPMHQRQTQQMMQQQALYTPSGPHGSVTNYTLPGIENMNLDLNMMAPQTLNQQSPAGSHHTNSHHSSPAPTAPPSSDGPTYRSSDNMGGSQVQPELIQILAEEEHLRNFNYQPTYSGLPDSPQLSATKSGRRSMPSVPENLQRAPSSQPPEPQAEPGSLLSGDVSPGGLLSPVSGPLRAVPEEIQPLCNPDGTPIEAWRHSTPAPNPLQEAARKRRKAICIATTVFVTLGLFTGLAFLIYYKTRPVRDYQLSKLILTHWNPNSHCFDTDKNTQSKKCSAAAGLYIKEKLMQDTRTVTKKKKDQGGFTNWWSDTDSIHEARTYMHSADFISVIRANGELVSRTSENETVQYRRLSWAVLKEIKNANKENLQKCEAKFDPSVCPAKLYNLPVVDSELFGYNGEGQQAPFYVGYSDAYDRMPAGEGPPLWRVISSSCKNDAKHPNMDGAPNNVALIYNARKWRRVFVKGVTDRGSGTPQQRNTRKKSFLERIFKRQKPNAKKRQRNGDSFNDNHGHSEPSHQEFYANRQRIKDDINAQQEKMKKDMKEFDSHRQKVQDDIHAHRQKVQDDIHAHREKIRDDIASHQERMRGNASTSYVKRGAPISGLDSDSEDSEAAPTRQNPASTNKQRAKQSTNKSYQKKQTQKNQRRILPEFVGEGLCFSESVSDDDKTAKKTPNVDRTSYPGLVAKFRMRERSHPLYGNMVDKDFASNIWNNDKDLDFLKTSTPTSVPEGMLNGKKYFFPEDIGKDPWARDTTFRRFESSYGDPGTGEWGEKDPVTGSPISRNIYQKNVINDRAVYVIAGQFAPTANVPLGGQAGSMERGIFSSRLCFVWDQVNLSW